VDGWIVEPRDVGQMTAVVQKILEGRAMLPDIGARARERAVREFSSELFIEQTEAVYRRTASGRTG
jgi:glycosyltransferase involved in cell wall biosynthesis